MFLLGLIVDNVAPIILDELATQLLIRVQNNAEGENAVAQLAAIEHKLEIGPLKVGLEFLKLGELNEAKHEFVRACIANQQSAVARLCLGILLYHEGKLQAGLENFKQAMEMNPLVCLPPFVQPAQIMTILNHYLPVPGDIAQEKAPFWVQHLQEKSLLESVPPNTDLFAPGRWLPTKGRAHDLLAQKMMKTGPILSASNNGRTIVVLWQLIEGPTSTQVLSVFEQVSGKCLWSLRVPNKRLEFSSSAYIILTSGSENTAYEFFSAESGQFITVMDEASYEVVFCPNVRQIHDMDEYKRSHCTMKEKAAIYTEGKYDYLVQAAPISSLEQRDDQEAYRKEYKDSQILSDPFQLSLYGINITNIWEYKSKFAGYRRLSYRAEGIQCRAKINPVLRLKNG